MSEAARFETYGVGLLIRAVREPEVQQWDLPAGATRRPTRLSEFFPPGWRTAEEKAFELRRVGEIEAQLAAYKAELLVSWAGDHPAVDLGDTADGVEKVCWSSPPTPSGLPELSVGEFFTDELAFTLGLSPTAGTNLLTTSMVLVRELPDTWAAVADGWLDWGRARVIATQLTDALRNAPPGVAAQVEGIVLPLAPELSLTGLAARVQRELQQLDEAAAERRREKARKTADVTHRRRGDGMGELSALLPVQDAAACRDTVDRLARLRKADGEQRSIGELRADVLTDLILRPWDTTRPAVTGHVTVLAPLPTLREAALREAIARAAAADEVADRDRAPGTRAATADGTCEPATLDGEPITGTHLRLILEDLDALCPGGLQPPSGGTLKIAITDPATGALRAVLTRPELERLVRRGCPAHDRPPGTASRDDSASSTAGCDCPLAGMPPAVDRYRPTPAQRRFVTTRDRTCRHPGCTNRAGWTDIDHTHAYGCGGATDCSNLCCLCRRHHRLKTRDTRWRYTMTPDGHLTVTTPTGTTRSTAPPGLVPTAGTETPDDDPPPF